MPSVKTFKPALGRILVEPIEHDGDRVLESGIIIPGTTRDRTLVYGTIVSDNSSTFEPETRVVFTQYAGFTINIDGCQYVILDESEILGSFL